MKQFKKVLSIFVLCTSLLFFSKNGHSQCSGFNVTASKTSDGSTLGDVSVTASATGGTFTSYQWYNGSSYIGWGAVINSLTAGTYCVYAFDSTSSGVACQDTFCLTVTDTGTFNCINLYSYTYNYDSCQYNDAWISANVYGGSGNYSYTWSNGATTSSIGGLSNGIFTVTIVDNTYGCTITKTDTAVDDTCNFCANFNNNGYISENDLCFQNDITLTAQIWGGSFNYSYLWNTGATTPSISNKTTGSYSCIITDNVYGCKDTLYLTVADDTCNPCSIFQANIYEMADPCGLNDVSLSAYPQDSLGSSNYSYFWNTGATTKDINNKTTGSYWVIVTNTVTGCSDSAYIYVSDDTCNPCSSFQANIYVMADSCGLNDIILSAYPQDSMGTTNYTYLWNTGSTLKTLYNKSAGSYWVKVTNIVTGCIDSAYITVSDNTCSPCDNFNAYLYNSDYKDSNDMEVYGYAYGGSGNYAFHWLNNNSTSTILYNQNSGYFTFVAIDLINGCKDTVVQYFKDSVWASSSCSNFYGYVYPNDSCLINDVSLTASVYNQNNSTFSFLWNTGETNPVIYGKTTGSYWVKITDNVNGCVDTFYTYAQDLQFKCCQAYYYTNDMYTGATKNYLGYTNTSISTSYNWNFGDNTTGSGQTPTHTYTSYGNYTACLFINDVAGCKDTICNVVINPIPAKNLSITHFGIPYIKDTNRYIYIQYQNLGNTIENATIEYKYPAGMTFVSSNISPTTNIGNTLTFNVGTLNPGDNNTMILYMYTPMSFTLGTILCDTARILTLTNDIAPSNNTSYDCDSVVSSWDPNEKMANPAGIGAAGNIDPSTKEINYLINFQNEGNHRTYKVRVEDEIDPAFDINSLLIGDASHAYRMVKTGRKLTWYFDNIELTPKLQNETQSKGYVQYTLKLNTNLPLGTQIKNTAYIYFDANPAIVTNTTKNTLKNADGNAAVRDRNQANLDFDANKLEERVIITSAQKMDAVRIYDLNGKLLINATPKSMKVEINAELISKQVYIIQVDMKEYTVAKKFQF